MSATDARRDAAAAPTPPSPPATLGAVLEDLLINTPERQGRPWPLYVALLAGTALLHAGFHMVLVHRLAAAAHRTVVGRPVSFVLERVIYHWYHCLIPSSARIGPGLFVPHPMGIILNKRARLGRGVTLRQYAQVIDVTEPGVDGVVGDRAQLNAFAMVVRGGSIGADSIVGARAVVTRPVPDGHVALGIPAECRPMRAEQYLPREPRWK